MYFLAHYFFTMGKNKVENKKAVEHCLDVTSMMQMEEDADHDAIMFMHVSRPAKGTIEPGQKEEIELNSFVHGCPCTIHAGIMAMMEQSEKFAHSVIAAVQEWKLKYDPMQMIAKKIADGFMEHIKAEKQAHKNSSDASKN